MPTVNTYFLAGAAMTLATIGVGYTIAMMSSALTIKKPHPSYKVYYSSC